MKIGIITHYYRSENYGGNLQAYALCKAIRALGYDAEQISYDKLKADDKKIATLKRTFKSILRVLNLNISHFPDKRIKQKLNERKNAILYFNRNAIPHSETVYDFETIKKANEEYDVFITGSDQVWHPYAVCPAYLLDFADEDKYKFSYAASIAKDELTREEKHTYKASLSRFQAISVREEKAAEIVGEIFNCEPKVVLDPTMLLTREEWDTIISEPQIKGKYLFCYFLGENESSRNLAKAYADKYNLKIVTMPYLLGSYRKCDEKFGDEQLFNISPDQFITLIKYADYVFTDSFHVCAFSAIYRKELFVFHRSHSNSMASRIYTLTRLFGIEERFCDTKEKETYQYIESLSPIDYEKDTSLFEKAKSYSIDFLKDNLSRAKNQKKANYPSLSETLCSGCGACKDMCPSGAISLVANKEGFLYPQIDFGKCIKCGKCEKKCPVKAKKNVAENDDRLAYAAKTKDAHIRENSSSGGIFTELANWIINQGGVVFGAALDAAFKVSHIAIEHIDDLDRLRGSKYVQSEIGDAYLSTKKHLDTGRLVLFTGTPCQIGGLLSFLGRDYNNLYTQDIICHGVPSPAVWRKYVEYREAKANSSLQRVFFRHKKHGWKNFSMQFEFANSTEYTQTLSEDLYMCSFLRNLSLRSSCYHCSFKSKNRPCDITLADYWGIDKVHPELDDDKGTSLVILHSEKGKQLFEMIKEKLEYLETDFETAIKYNTAMTLPVPINNQRERFIEAILGHGFLEGKKFLRTPFVVKAKKAIKAILVRIKLCA